MSHALRLSPSGEARRLGDVEPPFPWWSFSKTCIALLAMRFCEAGRLDMDAPLPGEPFSMRQLLSHRAGLPDYGGMRRYHQAVAAGEPPWGRTRFLSETRGSLRSFRPGERFLYSNPGYMLARERVETLAGADFETLVARELCAPLGLTPPRLARKPQDFLSLHRDAARSYHPGWVAHGCLIGAPELAARLLRGLFEGDLLGAEALAGMSRVTWLGGALPGRPFRRHGYATGLMVGEGEAGRMLGHSGGGPGSVCAVYHFPDLADRPTVAVFLGGEDEGRAENEALRLALGPS